MPLDLRFALRRLRRHLSVTTAAIATLGIGVGAITALFTVVNAVLLRPLPFRAPSELAVIEQVAADQSGTRLEVSYPDYVDWRTGTRAFQDLAAVQSALGRTVWESGRDVRTEQGSMVSGNFFALLGTPPRLGRFLTAGDDVRGAEPALVLSDRLWRRAFGGRPDALGTRVRIDGEAYTVVGVMPPAFDYPRNATYWRPIVPAVDSLVHKREIGFLTVIGRLRPGLTPAGAIPETSLLADRVARQVLPPDVHVSAMVTGLGEHLRGRVRPILLVALGATALVLIIACVNVASLLLAQAPGRRRELALRTALGAGRGRITRQLLLESLLLGTAGGALGIGLAVAAVNALRALVPPDLFLADAVTVDPVMVGFGSCVALLAAVGFGLAPVLAGARMDAPDVLRGGGRTSSGPGARGFLRGLVVVETAVAMVLLVAAGLLVNGYVRLSGVDPGPDPDRTLTLQVFASDPKFADARVSHALFTWLVERAGSVPGVEAAGGVLLRPLEGPQGFDYPFTIEGRGREEQASYPLLNYEAVTPGFFRSAGLHLRRGRALTAADRADAPRVVVLGESVARRFWPGADPVGRRLKWGAADSPAPWVTVVGVVEDSRYRGLEQVSLDAYVPFEQSPWPLNHLVLRTGVDPAGVIATLRRQVTPFEPSVRLLDVATVGTLMRTALARPRFAMRLLTVFGGVALVLSAIGLAGVLWFTTRERTREFGIRMALGASAGRIRTQVLREGLGLALSGLLAGALCAAGLAGLIRGLLFGVGPRDPATYAVTGAVLGSVALASCLLPAWRASREDVVVALRAE